MEYIHLHSVQFLFAPGHSEALFSLFYLLSFAIKSSTNSSNPRLDEPDVESMDTFMNSFFFDYLQGDWSWDPFSKFSSTDI